MPELLLVIPLAKTFTKPLTKKDKEKIEHLAAHPPDDLPGHLKPAWAQFVRQNQHVDPGYAADHFKHAIADHTKNGGVWQSDPIQIQDPLPEDKIGPTFKHAWYKDVMEGKSVDYKQDIVDYKGHLDEIAKGAPR